MGILYIVATPIGNLEDFTFRALRILQEADVILCEDTRVTKKLLAHYKIEKPLLSYHQHSKEDKMQEILNLLLQGKNFALVSDAGTPGISDPGNELIAWFLRRAEMHEEQNSTKTKQLSDFCTIPIVPIPGPSALTALASIVGIPMDKFLFLGFPPHKKKRKKFFEEIAESTHPVIFYESPFRVLKSLQELKDLDADLSLVVGRELTKAFETIYRGNIEDVLKTLQKTTPKGEFVVIAWKG